MLVRGTLRGMNRELECDVLLCGQPQPRGAFLRKKQHSMPEWTLLRAPLDLPDGEYTVTTSHGIVFHAKRTDGFWLHMDSESLPQGVSDNGIRAEEFRRWWLLAAGADAQQVRKEADSGGHEQTVARSAGSRFDLFADWMRIVGNRNAVLLFLATVGLLYALPTILELIAAHRAMPTMDIIVFGDLTGCVCLAILFGMPLTGVVLYLLLAAVEGFLCFAGILSASTLAWFTDLLPMVIAVRRIAVLRAAEDPNPS